MKAEANAPTRASNNITLRLGLMSLPVQLFTATEATKPVERKQFVRGTQNHPVGYLTVDKVTNMPVTSDDIAKMVLVDDQLIELTDDEIATATAGSAVDKGDVEVLTFVPLTSIGDTYLPETGRRYQVRPAPREVGRKKIADPHAQRLFALLLAAMRSKGVGALLRVGLRGTARYAVFMPDGFVQFLFFPGELRQPLAMPDVEIVPAELAQVEALIDAIGSDTPELVDDAKTAIEAFLTQKAGGTLPEAVATTPEPEAQILDLSAALAASVAAATAAKKKAS